MELSIYKDFSDTPMLRYCSLSERSGEEFYHTVLNKAFKECYDKKELLIINLDYTEGYAPSFLDESFGNLVFDFSWEIVEPLLKIVSNEEPFWIERIRTFCNNWETRRKQGERPTVTKEHDAWYRLVEGEIKCDIWEHPVA